MTRSLLVLQLLACGPPLGRMDVDPPREPSGRRDSPAAGEKSSSAMDRFRGRIADAQAALRARELDRAAAILAEADREAPTPRERELATYYQATLMAYRGDLERAADVLIAAAIPPDSPLAFSFHNSLIMLRTARRDLLGALIECERMVDVGQQGIWTGDQDSRTTVLLKKHWHRAYLLRIVAAMSGGSRRDAALRYAGAARDAFRKLAAPIADQRDAIAVLDAFFAVQDGDGRAALAAARRVNLAADEDVEDLYLAQMALDAGGDRAGAAAVRKQIAQSRDVSLAVPIISGWLESDMASARGGPPRWSPRHPTGELPVR
ncbi:MAG TPA: hypothetical protein VKB80_24835 [Kofleriaceae bacterium]|nr:hypothetical protein [Kofleriaceae bacterium]